MAEQIIFDIDLDATKIAADLARISKASADLRQERAELNKQLKANEITEEQYTRALTQNTLATQRLSKQRQDSTRQLKAVQQATDSASGSLKEQQALLRLLQDRFDNLSDREGKNIEVAKALQKQIDSLNGTVLEAEKSTGRAQRQVGFYDKALQDVAGSINVYGVNLGRLGKQLNEYKELLIQQIASTKANTAATNARTAASEREAAVTSANTAAVKINTSTTSQNTAATASNTVTMEGNTVATGVNTQSTVALTAAQRAATAATASATKALQFLKVALISTGIGAIVVLLGTLAAAFLSTQEGIDKATAALNPLKVAFQTIVGFIQNTAIKAFNSPKEALQDLGDFIVGQFTNRIKALQGIFDNTGKAISAVFKRDFKGAREAISNVGSNFVDLQTGVTGTIDKVSEFGQEVKTTADEITALEIAVRKLTNRNEILVASLREQAQEQKAIAQDQSKTAQERAEAGRRAIELLKEQEKAQLELVDAEIKLLEKQQSPNDTLDEELLQLAKLQAERSRITKERIQQSTEVNNQVNAAIKQQVAAEKAAQAEIIKNNEDAAKRLAEIRKGITLDAIANANERTAEELRIEFESQKAQIDLLKVSTEQKNQLLLALEEQFRAKDKANYEAYLESLQESSDTAALKQLNQRQADAEALAQLDILQATSAQERREAELALLQTQYENEIALFDGSEAQRALLDEQYKQKRIDLSNQLRDVEIQNNLSILNSTASLFSSIASLAGENAAAQKSAALAQIAVDSAIAIAGAVRAAQNVGFPANLAAVATGVATVVANISRARQILSNDQFEDGGVVKFAQGGNIAFEGGYIPKDGGMIRGRSHAQGGVKFAMGGGIGEAQGNEAYILNVGGNPVLKQLASAINVAGGGKPFASTMPTTFDAGGIATSTRNNPSTVAADALRSISATPIYVAVTDINTGLGKYAQVVDRANT